MTHFDQCVVAKINEKIKAESPGIQPKSTIIHELWHMKITFKHIKHNLDDHQIINAHNT